MVRYSEVKIPLLLVGFVILLSGVVFFSTKGNLGEIVGREPRDLPFDSMSWKGAPKNGKCRGDMYQDLLRKHKLEGMSREELTQLLGPADHTEKQSAKDNADGSSSVAKDSVEYLDSYFLGLRGLSELNVQVKNGKIVSCRVLICD